MMEKTRAVREASRLLLRRSRQARPPGRIAQKPNPTKFVDGKLNETNSFSFFFLCCARSCVNPVRTPSENLRSNTSQSAAFYKSCHAISLPFLVRLSHSGHGHGLLQGVNWMGVSECCNCVLVPLRLN